jgi:hypothetical protein
MKRYVCDGYHDCKGGEDESEGECGMYVCYFKLLALCFVLYQNSLN